MTIQEKINAAQLINTVKDILRKIVDDIATAVTTTTVTATTVNATYVSLGNDVVFLKVAGVPVDGVSGTGAGVAGPGSVVSDYTNANLYVNANTKASPTWKLVTRAA